MSHRLVRHDFSRPPTPTPSTDRPRTPISPLPTLPDLPTSQPPLLPAPSPRPVPTNLTLAAADHRISPDSSAGKTVVGGCEGVRLPGYKPGRGERPVHSSVHAA